MDDRYTMIDDEALDEARQKMDAFQRERGLILRSSSDEQRIEHLKKEIRRLEAKTAYKNGASQSTCEK